MSLNWGTQMASAYSAGLADGKRGRRFADVTRGNGFDACYWQGYGHGSGECLCPNPLSGKRDGRRCVNCGKPRTP